LGSGKCVYDVGPDASPPPANEAVIASSVWTERTRQIAPRGPRSQDPENAIQDAAIVYPRNTSWLIRQHRLDDNPFIIGEFVAHDSSPQFWEFESQGDGQTQRSLPSPRSALTDRSGHQRADRPAESVEQDPKPESWHTALANSP
jgi:hypothetical protein